MNLNNINVTENICETLGEMLRESTPELTPKQRKPKAEVDEQQYHRFYLQSKEYRTNKRRVKRDTIKRMKEYGGVFD